MAIVEQPTKDVSAMLLPAFPVVRVDIYGYIFGITIKEADKLFQELGESLLRINH